MPSILIEALGCLIEVETNQEPFGQVCRTMLHDLLADLPTTRKPDQVVSVGPTPDPMDVLTALVGTINFGAIEAARGHLLPHAGAVARADGSVVLLCAPAGSGKSTLTATLILRGFAYVTDETVALNADRMIVTPFRKPLAIKTTGQHLWPHLRPRWQQDSGTWMVPSGALGGPPLPDATLTPDLLVFPQFVAGSSTRMEPVADGEAAYLVGQQSSALADVAGGPLSALARLTRRAPAYRLVYGDNEAAADAVLEVWAA